jgi:hypothetical protein
MAGASAKTFAIPVGVSRTAIIVDTSPGCVLLIQIDMPTLIWLNPEPTISSHGGVDANSRKDAVT